MFYACICVGLLWVLPTVPHQYPQLKTINNQDKYAKYNIKCKMNKSWCLASRALNNCSSTNQVWTPSTAFSQWDVYLLQYSPREGWLRPHSVCGVPLSKIKKVKHEKNSAKCHDRSGSAWNFCNKPWISEAGSQSMTELQPSLALPASRHSQSRLFRHPAEPKSQQEHHLYKVIILYFYLIIILYNIFPQWLCTAFNIEQHSLEIIRHYYKSSAFY